MPHDAGLPEPSSHLPLPHLRDSFPPAARHDAPHGAARLAPAAPPGLSAAPDVMTLLSALRHRWVSAVLLGGALGAIAGIAAWFALTPKHTAFAQLQIGYTDKLILGNPGGSPGDFRTYLQTTAGEITSRRVIASALKRDEVKRLGLDSMEVDAAQAVADDLRVDFKENSELLAILYSHANPHIATTVVNGVKEAYLEDIVYAKQSERNRKVTELEKIYADNVDALKRKKDSLKNLADKLGTTDPALWREQRLETIQNLKEAKSQHVQTGFQLIRSRAELDTYDARVKVAQARAAALTSGTPSAPGSPVVKIDPDALEEALETALSRDSMSQQLRSRIGRYETEIDTLRSKGFNERNVSMQMAMEAAGNLYQNLDRRRDIVLERVKKALAAKAAAAALPGGPGMPQYNEDPAIMRAQLKKQVDELARIEETLRKDIEKLSKDAAKTPVLASEYDQLAVEIKSDEVILNDIRGKLERERVELRAANRIRKFQDAELMRRDTKKQMMATAAAPVAVFSAVGLGLAWLEFRRRRVRSASEISRGLGIRVVGAVPQMPHLERHLVGVSGESELEGTPVMESIDAIRTRLLHEATTRSTRVVMVTSAGPGEGKTTLASALATSLARAGRRTLLVDGDLRRPTVHELFEVAMQPGFSEVLLAEVEMADAAQESQQENLWVMPSGQWDREVLLALSRGGLEGVFERLAEEFDFVIVDSHPVLEATDSLLIGRQADAVLLSVLREVSETPRVYAASQQLAAVGIRVLGAVVIGACPEEVYTSAGTPVAA